MSYQTAHSGVGGGLLLPRVGRGSPKGFHLQTLASPPGWAGVEEGCVCIPECVCLSRRQEDV